MIDLQKSSTHEPTSPSERHGSETLATPASGSSAAVEEEDEAVTSWMASTTQCRTVRCKSTGSMSCTGGYQGRA